MTDSPPSLPAGGEQLAAEDPVEAANRLREWGNKLFQGERKSMRMFNKYPGLNLRVFIRTDKHFNDAATQYSLAIELAPSAVLYGNRAMAYLKLEDFGLAIEDSEKGRGMIYKRIIDYFVHLIRRLYCSYRTGPEVCEGLLPQRQRLFCSRKTQGWCLINLRLPINYAISLIIIHYILYAQLAKRDFKLVTDLYPNDVDAKKRLAACEKAIREEAFLKAIETDNEGGSTGGAVPKPEDFVVEPDYQGPRLPDDGSVTVDFVLRLMEDFKLEKALHRRYVVQILLAARKLMLSLPSLVDISLPAAGADGSASSSLPPAPPQVFSGAQFLMDSRPHVTVCGDTHGQFYDLCNIFNIGGLPSSSNPYLFNGDFVDRGSFSFEVVMVLLAWKLANPACIHLTRGNHESSIMNKMYGFEGEVKHKMKDDRIMNLFKSVFNSIPLASVVGGKVFVVHGGLSTQPGVTLADIRALNRDREPPSTGLMADLLWSGKTIFISFFLYFIWCILTTCFSIPMQILIICLVPTRVNEASGSRSGRISRLRSSRTTGWTLSSAPTR